jgi:hypothetical protein
VLNFVSEKVKKYFFSSHFLAFKVKSENTAKHAGKFGGNGRNVIYGPEAEGNWRQQIPVDFCDKIPELEINCHTLIQAWATSGPRASCGPPSILMWPTNIFLRLIKH